MVETSRPDSQSHSPTSNSTSRPQSTGGRQRIISSCLTCRRRKVRCDHGHPICGACTRGNHVCTYAADQGLGAISSNRIAKPGTTPLNGKGVRNGTDVQARLDRLELLLEKAVAGQTAPIDSRDGKSELVRPTRQDSESGMTPSSNSQSSQGAGISSDNHDGTLLLDGGQSQFVSSLHYALLADEIQDIKALLGEQTVEEDPTIPTRNKLINYLSLGRAKIGISLQRLLPSSQQQQDALLDIFFANVDPMIRIIHRPTLIRKFPYYVSETHPLAWAVFFSAINSLPPAVVEEKFGDNKEELLARYELGLEISLAREQYLTTSSLEVVQAFIIWLTCITKEDDMGKAWALLGVALRIALNQGLHRDPSLFPSGSMDAITIEVRRRLWHQICHLEYRAAECKGQEPSITDETFTTMLPRNIDDDDLVEGASPAPGPYDEERVTSMTFQLVRFIGMRTLRRIVQTTYRLERRMLECGLRGTSAPDPVHELQTIYEQIKAMVDEMHEEYQRKYLRFCNTNIPMHRITVGLSSLLEWRCYLLFWLRMPRAYRDVVFSNDIRKSIFCNSVNCVETLNGAGIDVDAARFHWHIGGHAAFQAIMHMLSELRNPLFDAPDRQRALRALRMCRLLKEDNDTKAWKVIKSMIDKVLNDQFKDDQRSGSQSSGSNAYPSPSMANANNPNRNMPIYMDRMPDHAYQRATEPAITQPPQMLQQQQLQQQSQGQLPHPQTLQQPPPQQQEQFQQPQFNWDEINWNNIVGDVALQPNPELPEFDWGFWGDPVNFNDPSNVQFSIDGDAFAPFNPVPEVMPDAPNMPPKSTSLPF